MRTMRPTGFHEPAAASTGLTVCRACTSKVLSAGVKAESCKINPPLLVGLKILLPKGLPGLFVVKIRLVEPVGVNT